MSIGLCTRRDRGPDVRDNQSESRQWTLEISDLKFEISKKLQLQRGPNRDKPAPQGPPDLSLRELEALARALLAVFLAFLDSRIARNQSCLL
jgi:hypothetical protein